MGIRITGSLAEAGIVPRGLDAVRPHGAPGSQAFEMTLVQLVGEPDLELFGLCTAPLHGSKVENYCTREGEGRCRGLPTKLLLKDLVNLCLLIAFAKYPEADSPWKVGAASLPPCQWP